MKIKIRAVGTPIPQGSTRAFAVRRRGGVPTGRVVVTADNPKTRTWRQAVIEAVPPGAEKFAGPVEVLIMFILPRPAHHYGTGRNMGQVRPAAPPAPAVKPDLDKLARAVLDALTDAGLWLDDAQVCKLTAEKGYPRYGLEPGALIEVTGLA